MMLLGPKMLTHHFTIIQHKFFYVTEDCDALWFHEGLAPSDAVGQGCLPILTLTLNVEKLGIYHQKFYRHDDAISLADFFYEAWTHNLYLGGIPDRLCVDQKLLDDYPLVQILKKLDPSGHIKTIIPNAGRSFGASKAQAQKQSKLALTWNDLEEEPRPKTIESMLIKLSKNLANYSIFDLENSYITKPEIKVERQHHKERTPFFPVPVGPSSYKFIFDKEWIYKAAEAVPLIAQDQFYFHDEEAGWVKWLSLGYENDRPEPSEAADYVYYKSPGYRWASELDGIDSVISALVYPLDDFLPSDLNAQRLKAFISGREALPVAMASSLEDSLKGLPIILLPDSIKAMIAAYECVSMGGDLRCAYELYGGKQFGTDYRIVACDGYSQGLFLIIIKTGSKTDISDLDSVLINFNGKLDIGPAGFSALTYWLPHLIESQHMLSNRIVIEMAEAMLGSMCEWTTRA